MSFRKKWNEWKGIEMVDKGDDLLKKSDHADILRTPALGRPFRLGMLYDRVHDTIIPGETLLTMQDMENHTFKENRNGYVLVFIIQKYVHFAIVPTLGIERNIHFCR